MAAMLHAGNRTNPSHIATLQSFASVTKSVMIVASGSLRLPLIHVSMQLQDLLTVYISTAWLR